MEQNIIFEKINNSLDLFYEQDVYLVRQGLCERCLQHRLAVHLENQSFPSYYVDCEYNKSHLNELTSPKIVSSIHGNIIDIIITRRSGNHEDDLACFEIKRSGNMRGRANDREKLRILTTGEQFDYDYGFYLILGQTRESVLIEVYFRGLLQIRSEEGRL